MTSLRTGGQILVDQLVLHGVQQLFCVPGESFLAVLDALHDTPEIDLVVCRQEGGVGFMACADGALTGRPGVAFEGGELRLQSSNALPHLRDLVGHHQRRHHMHAHIADFAEGLAHLVGPARFGRFLSVSSRARPPSDPRAG